MTRRRRGGSTVAAASWLTTYSDLVTLLLCFFVLLYSFSAIDIQKFRRFVLSFQGQGVLDGGAVPDTVSPAPEEEVGDVATESEEPFYEESGRLMVHVQEFLETHAIEAEVQVYQEVQGVVLELKDHLLFDSGRATIRAEGMGLLNTLSLLFNQFPNQVTVQGHTDNVPISTVEFPTNWELSTSRATRVVRYFVEVRELNPHRFSAAGYGEFQPVDSNETSEGRSRNRRVVFLLRGF
ncbi:MAG: OmpA family protein [Thermaerobacter sp.]|nr:OmpA family protein [Thermaerobacter sp.]